MVDNSKPSISWMDSFVITGVGITAIYWLLESFLFFFLRPEANFIQHLIGPGRFEVWTRLLVLCMFLIFGSHVQYTLEKRRAAESRVRDYG